MVSEHETLTRNQQTALQRNLKRFRAELSKALGQEFTQEACAEAAGLKVDTLRTYENGRRGPKIAPLIKLASVFGRTVEDMLSLDPPDLPPGKLRGWIARLHVIGTPPAGLEAEIEAVLKKYRDRNREERDDDAVPLPGRRPGSKSVVRRDLAKRLSAKKPPPHSSPRGRRS